MATITTMAYKIVRYSGLPFFIREFVQRHKITFILFHDIKADLFEQHVCYLLKTYHIISLQQYLDARKTPQFKLPPKSLIITLDDGLKRNYDLLPVIKKHRIPITIFLCSSIVCTHRRYWMGVSLSGHPIEVLKRMPTSERDHLLLTCGFDPMKEFAVRESLGSDEIKDMKGFVDFQSHTRFHAILPYCENERAEDEILTSKRELEAKLNSAVTSISYPNGDYSERDLVLAKKGGYELGITVDFGFNTLRTDAFRLKRLCIRDDADRDELIVKSTGAWQFLKRFFRKEDYGYHEAKG
jgi:poly-beta-1,6-N-acetyl-D-glucosamine N-deacetylase